MDCIACFSKFGWTYLLIPHHTQPQHTEMHAHTTHIQQHPVCMSELLFTEHRTHNDCTHTEHSPWWSHTHPTTHTHQTTHTHTTETYSTCTSELLVTKHSPMTITQMHPYHTHTYTSQTKPHTHNSNLPACPSYYSQSTDPWQSHTHHITRQTNTHNCNLPAHLSYHSQSTDPWRSHSHTTTPQPTTNHTTHIHTTPPPPPPPPPRLLVQALLQFPLARLRETGQVSLR